MRISTERIASSPHPEPVEGRGRTPGARSSYEPGTQNMTQKTWRVGVAGLGTVGGGLLQFLAERPDFAPAGDRAVVTAVSARSRSRPRTIDISGLAWFDDPVALASSPDVDLFVEL